MKLYIKGSGRLNRVYLERDTHGNYVGDPSHIGPFLRQGGLLQLQLQTIHCEAMFDLQLEFVIDVCGILVVVALS
jgi:hypothetical protein